MHNMRVKEPYYTLLKSGTKTIELRLFDEKRQQIHVGDIIQFSNAGNAVDTFQARVTHLHHAPDFQTLCAHINPEQAGFKTVQELLSAVSEFYSPDDQKQFGIIGIEIALI